MGNTQQLISLIAFLVGILGFVCFLLLLTLYIRKERRQRTDWEKTEADKADIMLLFQTMRDVIGQQKNLARDFNQELDRKMKMVKQILAQSMEKNERLYDKQQDLVRDLEEARAELRSLQRQTGFLKENPPRHAPPTRHEKPRPAAPPASEPFLSLPGETGDQLDLDAGLGSGEEAADTFAEIPDPVPAPPPRPAAPPAARQGTSADGFREIIEGLTGSEDDHEDLDVYLDEDDPVEAHRESPAAADEARSAFRSLLDMTPDSVPAAAAVNGNGGRSPLQKRVIEYHDAGMPIADIARELGIGKGEVRLMLSLARQEKG